MFKPISVAITIGYLAISSLTSFVCADIHKNTELMALFEKSKTPEYSDLMLDEKWTCSVDGIQFIFSLNSERKLINKINSNPLIEYRFDEQALKIVRKHPTNPTKERIEEHIRVLKDQSVNQNGGLIVKQLIVDQYYICPQSKVSPLYSLEQHIDFLDLNLPNITMSISIREIEEQEKLYPATVSFETALSEALKNLYEDNKKMSLLDRMASTLEKLQTEKSQLKTIQQERLHGILNQSSTILGLLTPSQAIDFPFDGEFLKSNWIFQLEIKNILDDEIFWIFVSRTGEKATYNRSFN